MERKIFSAAAAGLLMATNVAWARTKEAPQPKTVEISGAVKRGEKFEKEIWPGVVFRLKPMDLGWIVEVGPAADPAVDYSGVVTPPFHGTNALFIEGWHFRNQDNTGPNTGDVNAPTEERAFRYVSNPKEYERADQALTKYLYTYNSDNQQRDRDIARLSDVIDRQAYQGNVKIHHIELGNLVAGRQAWIESMDFTASFETPK